MYFFVYTPSNQHFKAFLVSKFNSETTFLYQLFNENKKFTVYKPFNMFLQVYMYIYIYNTPIRTGMSRYRNGRSEAPVYPDFTSVMRTWRKRKWKKGRLISC